MNTFNRQARERGSEQNREFGSGGLASNRLQASGAYPFVVEGGRFLGVRLHRVATSAWRFVSTGGCPGSHATLSFEASTLFVAKIVTDSSEQMFQRFYADATNFSRDTT